MTITIVRPAPAHHSWRLRGNCTHVDDPDVMYPAERDRRGTQQAKNMCGGCPVAGECLADSLRLKDWQGIRAGLTGRERELLAKRQQMRRHRATKKQQAVAA